MGIAEQHAVTFAGGLASMGQIPVFAVYSTFLQRAYDQLIHDVAIGGLHIVLGVDRAGIVGEDGETHQGMFDVPMLTTIPNTVIYSPSCYEELRSCLNKAIYDESGLAAVRYPRGAEDVCFDRSIINTNSKFLRSGSYDTLIISYGRIFNEAYKAQSLLDADGIGCDLLKLTKIFPIEEELIKEILSYRNVFFFEESVGEGSISQKFGSLLMENDYSGRYRRIAANGFIKQAAVKSCLDKLGLLCGKMADLIRSGRMENGKA